MPTFQIHPSVGVARVGNSRDSFYLAPDTIGGRPYECDRQGNLLLRHGRPVPVKKYKDEEGRIRRQGALFRIFQTDEEGTATEVTTSDENVRDITWTVHLANKKAAWYSFSELEGNLMFGEDNSYGSRQVPLRNATTTDRQSLIIDPGPRTVTGPGQQAEFDRGSIPSDYKHGSFPPANPSQGYSIDTLGGLRTDDRGRLVVLGGFGKAGGNDDIEGFGGADTWNDDISDGAVYCTLELEDGTVHKLTAWCIVGSPKFAPELVNPVTLDDNVFDVAVRYHGLVPEMYGRDGFNNDYRVNFDRDVLPIIRRPLDSLWVANVPTMAVFAAPLFDVRDNSGHDVIRAARKRYASYFRRPGWDADGQQNQLWSGDNDADTGSPMMPLQSGSNSVWNILIDKFLTLTETQYFCLQQWADGKFEVGPASDLGIDALDRASLGNCVGGPMCPGIEVTWTTTNPSLFDPKQPFRILHAHDEEYYLLHGLNAMREETTEPPAPGAGCEPGDLTKRMAIPWQADFFQCTAQFINYTNPDVNKDANHIPVPPTFYGYWWPPQSPMYVLSGYTSWEDQKKAGVPAGFQVYYPRGINSFGQMITSWHYMGFIVNQNEAEDRTWYPYFVEKERNNDQFIVSTIAVGGADQFVNADNTTFWPMWHLKSDDQPPPPVPGKKVSGEEPDRPRPVRAPARPTFGRRHHHEPHSVAVAETEDTSSSHK